MGQYPPPIIESPFKRPYLPSPGLSVRPTGPVVVRRRHPRWKGSRLVGFGRIRYGLLCVVSWCGCFGDVVTSEPLRCLCLGVLVRLLGVFRVSQSSTLWLPDPGLSWLWISLGSPFRRFWCRRLPPALRYGWCWRSGWLRECLRVSCLPCVLYDDRSLRWEGPEPIWACGFVPCDGLLPGVGGGAFTFGSGVAPLPFGSAGYSVVVVGVLPTGTLWGGEVEDA